ncbi:MAG: glycoside hydrolase family 2 protein, partial [Bacteroidetes bacterium]|nr:glycoside hydrolase family 2 protein [Bacteroidota bacterium]
DFDIGLSFNSKLLDEKIVEIGLRTIELIQDKDSVGKSFYFKLNGVPVFMKGANYIPSDNFLPRVTKDDYEKIVENAVDANMNMLRVWGGGVYADDEFYKQCDMQGILVWQDFMFACAMYPGDNHFVNNVAQEVIDQVQRLRNHPCLALWCGNNEVDEGWKNWEWQKQFHYSEKDSTTIAQNNSALFDNFIKDMVNAYDGSRAYWPSSPSIGWGHKESLQEGDSHYWGVWWGNEPFENYNKKVGRFVSEYGFQGMPDLNSIKKYARILPSADTEELTSADMRNHQKHPVGYETILKYMSLDYKVPSGLDNFSYVSQLLQAEGMKTAIEAHRRAKPYCMGTLYWQLNDCWPVTSWSSVDYYNNWKASQYQVKRSFESTILSIDEQDSVCDVYLISDDLKNQGAWLRLQLFDFSGKILWSDSMTAGVSSASAEKVYTFDKKILNGFDKSSVVLKASYTAFYSSNILTYALHYFEKPKDLKLQKTDIVFSLGESLFSHSITLKSKTLMKDVCVTIEGEIIHLSDNCFDLLPNEEKTIDLPPYIYVKHLDKKIKIKSLVDTY